jgi:hypothetical protein
MAGFELKMAILLTLYKPYDEFLTRNRSYTANIIILQDKHLFIFSYFCMEFINLDSL